MLRSILLLTLALAIPASAAPRYDEREVRELMEIAAAEKQPENRRALAIRELEKTDSRLHMSLLRRLLREERSLDIRLASACTLAALGDRKAPRDLLLATAYDHERTPNCSHSDVLLALARTREPAGAMHLEKALTRDAPANEPYYYSDVLRALRILDTPAAQKILIKAIGDSRSDVRHAAVSPLAALAVRKEASNHAAAQSLREVARLDPDEKVAEQAASALLWSGVDGTYFFRLLETDPDPKVRARAARVMNRHYLNPSRLQRLRSALAVEVDPSVQAAMQETLRSQKAQ
jgi:HEAT repeat protein